jgi:hypothetical protein
VHSTPLPTRPNAPHLKHCSLLKRPPHPQGLSCKIAPLPLFCVLKKLPVPHGSLISHEAVPALGTSEDTSPLHRHSHKTMPHPQVAFLLRMPPSPNNAGTGLHFTSLPHCPKLASTIGDLKPGLGSLQGLTPCSARESSLPAPLHQQRQGPSQ